MIIYFFVVNDLMIRELKIEKWIVTKWLFCRNDVTHFVQVFEKVKL